MPIVISLGGAAPQPQVVHGERQVSWDSTPAGLVRGTRAAAWTSGRIVQGARPVRWTPSGQLVQGTRVVAWGAGEVVREFRVVSYAAAEDAQASWPVVVRRGRPGRAVDLSSNRGQVISADYSHTGTRETLTLTVLGEVAAGSGFVSLTAVEREGQAELGRFSVTLDADPTQYEVRLSSVGKTTLLYAYNRAASRLGSVRLGELIPWKLSPTPLPDRRVPCAARLPPQTIEVGAVLVAAFAAAGMGLAFSSGNPLAGQRWKEGIRDYSTRGKTPDQVFSETVGQVGYTYVVRGSTAYALLRGEGFPGVQPVRAEDVTGDLTVRGEAANVPSKITATGADLRVPKKDLLELIGDAPDLLNLQRELAKNAEWFETTATADGEVTKGYRKAGGVITQTAERTLSDVTVTGTVDGEQVSRTFSRVATGYTSTDFLYDPFCPDALLVQATTKRSWGYDLGTETHGVFLGGPGFAGYYEGGNLLAEETQRIEQRWSPQGYLASRTTTTRKLVSLKQTNAEGAPAERGPLEAHEYATQILSEAWLRVQGGRWQRTWSLSGPQQLPLYDQETGEAVRLGTRGGSSQTGVEVTDAAPPQIRCPDPCAEQVTTYPQVLELTSPTGREGAEMSLNLGMVEDAAVLTTVLQIAARGAGPSVASDGTLSHVADWRPGVRLAGALTGIVEAYSLNAQGGQASCKVTARRVDPLGGPTESAVDDVGPWRDTVLYGVPGGVIVNHLRAIEDGEPKFVHVLVRVSGAILPSPGDELEWRQDSKFGPTATGNYGS